MTNKHKRIRFITKEALKIDGWDSYRIDWRINDFIKFDSAIFIQTKIASIVIHPDFTYGVSIIESLNNSTKVLKIIPKMIIFHRQLKQFEEILIRAEKLYPK